MNYDIPIDAETAFTFINYIDEHIDANPVPVAVIKATRIIRMALWNQTPYETIQNL